jgi:choline dehydrogenase-like flavoprotein
MFKNPDICIIGSGAAGSFLANTLKEEKGLSVLILETGNHNSDSNSDRFINDIKIDEVNNFNYGFSRQTGGSTNLWAGRVAPFEQSDLTKKQSINVEGWPIDIEDLAPFYNKASEIMGLPPYEYFLKDEATVENKQTNNLINICKKSHLEIKKFIWSTPAFNSRTTILKSIVNNKHKHIKLIEDCHVTQLIENNARDSIIAVEFIDGNGRKRTIKPKYTVLSAGGIETPRILLNSTSQSPLGIANDHDVVGRYFSTHPKADMGVLILNKSCPIDHPLFSDCNEDAISTRRGIGLNQITQTKNELLNHYIQLTPMLEYTSSLLFERVKNVSVLNSKLINKNKVLTNLLPALGHIIFEIIGRIAKLQQKSKKYILRTFLDQHPNKDNRIYLSKDLDEYGFSKANIEWEFSKKDRDSVLHFFRELDGTLKENDIGTIEYSKLEELEKWPITAIHSHFMGTTRMGNDPKTSVVDKNCQAHGYSNLFIAGPSVFPTYGYANPVYTIAALSIRLGEFLKRVSRQA